MFQTHRLAVRLKSGVCLCRTPLPLASTMSTPQVRDSLKYTRICKYWSSNRCKLGQDCNFAHSELELRDQPDLVATRLCFQFSSKGRCKKGDDCKFAHGKNELRSLPKAETRNDEMEPMKIQVGNLSPMAPLSPRSALTAPLSPRSPLSPCSPFGNIGPWASTTGRVHGYTPARGLKQSLELGLVPTLSMPPMLSKELTSDTRKPDTTKTTGIILGPPPGLSMPGGPKQVGEILREKDTSSPSTSPPDEDVEPCSEPTSPKSDLVTEKLMKALKNLNLLDDADGSDLLRRIQGEAFWL